MAYKVVETDKARDDLDEIIAYLADTPCNKTAADALLADADVLCDRISEFPFAYPACEHALLTPYHFRKAVLNEGYLVIYRVDERRSVVYVERYFSQLEAYTVKLL